MRREVVGNCGDAYIGFVRRINPILGEPVKK